MKRRLVGLAAVVAVTVLTAGLASAATTVVVTPTNTQGWSTSDTRPGGGVNFVVDSTAPAGVGALQLTTDATTAAKAQYLHAADVLLSQVTELGYYTKQNSASFVGGDASYQLPVCLGGVTGTTCNGFTTLVFEPYENGVVVPGAWQHWDVAAGQFWSSRSYSNGTCTVLAGGGGPPFYTLAGLQAACPNAVAVQFGVNVGSNNPSYDVETDLVDFNGTVYDFEPYAVARSMDQCKDGGWQNVRRADGTSFKNQGDCIQYVNTGK
ncbi:MAG TPA: hypothetical protein VFD32_04765 [Dehalococcoidia bacterium]|nr:hypothetical protein [Dehalococcoidia bacterium]